MISSAPSPRHLRPFDGPEPAPPSLQLTWSVSFAKWGFALNGFHWHLTFVDCLCLLKVLRFSLPQKPLLDNPFLAL